MTSEKEKESIWKALYELLQVFQEIDKNEKE